MSAMMTDDTRYALTRRNFFRMALGSLTVLPAVAGGFLVEAPLAYADESDGAIRREEDGGPTDSATTKIVLVSPSEVGVHVVDTAFGGRVVIPGAEVTLTSRYNGKSIKGTTKDDGIVTFDISGLAEDLEGVGPDKLDTFAFNGTIRVTCPGYRDFEMALTRIEGGGGVTAATRNLKDGERDPYPRMVALNEWDVLYTENTFLSTPMNDADQELKLEFVQMPKGDATVLLKDRGSQETLMSTTATVGADGVLKASFEGKFLQKGTENALLEDSLYEIEVVQEDSHTICPIQLIVECPPIETQVDSTDYIMKPIDGTMTNLQEFNFKWPSAVPILGGSDLKAFAPNFPVHVSVNPLGYLQLAVASPTWGYFRDTGGVVPQGWQTFPDNSIKDAWNKGKKNWEEGWEKAKNAFTRTYIDEKTGKETTKAIEKVDMFSAFKFSVNLQAAAIAQWDNDTKAFQGLFVGEVYVVFSSTLFTVNFWVGFIPVLISFDVSLSAMFNLGAGFYTLPDSNADAKEISIDPRKWKLDYSNSGLTITFNLLPSVTAGIGVRGVGSISVKGMVQITVVMGLTARGELDPSIYKLPHWKAGWSAKLVVIVSAFLFSQCFTVLDTKYRQWLDTWEAANESKVKQSAFRRANETDDDLEVDDSWKRPSETIDMFTMLSQLKIMDDATLATTAEFEGSTPTRLLASDPDTDDEVFDWDDIKVGYREVPLDNGTMIGYTVYSLKTTDDDDPDGSPEQEAPDAQGAPLDQEAEPTATSVGEAAFAGRLRMASSKNLNTPTIRKRPRLARRPSKVTYQPIGVQPLSKSGSHLAQAQYRQASVLADEPGVAGIGKHGGIRPDTDKIVAGNTSGDASATPYVFGDSHLKIATLTTSIDNMKLRVTCSFRIGTVIIDGQPRSRIIMTVIDAQAGEGQSDSVAKSYIGYSKPLDFEFSNLKGVSHADLYDYDFDIAFTTSSSEYSTIDMVHIVVVSGKRAYDDATSIVEASTNLVFSYANFRASEAFGRTSYLVMSISASEALGSGSYDDLYHCISNVRIATDGTDESPHLLVGVLDRCSDTAEGVLSDNYGDGTGGTVKTRVTFAIIDQVMEEWWMPDRSDVDNAMDVSFITSGTVLSMKISPKIRDAYTVTLTSTDETYIFVMKLDDAQAAFTSIKMAAMLESGMRLVPWPQENCFLTTYPSKEYLQELDETGAWMYPDSWDRSKWVLQKAWWVEEIDNPEDPTSTTPVLAFEPIGPEGFSIDTFGINSNGTFIFWSQSREGNDCRIYDDDGSYEPLDEDDENLYQLMACRVYGGYFSDPFVVAEVDHDMADLAIVATRNVISPLEILSIEHMPSGTDDEGNPIYLHHAANVWYTAVPHVALATAVDCFAPVPFVSAGGTLKFNVTIRNDGNCYLKGCTLQLCLHSATTDDSGNVDVSKTAVRVEGSIAKLEINESTLVESHFNPKDDVTGQLENVEADFTLAPGKCSVYEVRIPIPADWDTGDKYVSFIAMTDPVDDVATGGALSFRTTGPKSAAFSGTGGFGMRMAADEDDVIYRTYDIEPGEFKPYLQRVTPDVDKHQTHMDHVTVNEAIANANDLRDAPLTHWAGPAELDPAKDDPARDDPTRDDPTRDDPTKTDEDKPNLNGNGDTNAKAPSKGAGDMPDTGDASLSAQAALVAGAGAVAIAYGAHCVNDDWREHEE